MVEPYLNAVRLAESEDARKSSLALLDLIQRRGNRTRHLHSPRQDWPEHLVVRVLYYDLMAALIGERFCCGSFEGVDDSDSDGNLSRALAGIDYPAEQRVWRTFHAVE